MKNILTAKVAVALVVATLLAGGAIFAGHGTFRTQLRVGVALSFIGDPIDIYLVSGDGSLTTPPLASGDNINFGTVLLDYWGAPPIPKLRIAVKNFSSLQQRVVVSGDLSGDLLPLFGLTAEEMAPAPGNAFVLKPTGLTGDMVMGWLGLALLPASGDNLPSLGTKQTTIIFSAAGFPDPMTTGDIDFEDPGLGQLCLFSNANPLRDEYLHSQGVTFSGDSAVNGLAVLHECSNLETSSHSTGDYFLAGSSIATMANGGVPWLPEVISFDHPVSEVWFFGCICGSDFGSYTLFLHGYDGPDATGSMIASDSRPTTKDWQLWKVTAPANSTFRSAVLTYTGDAHTLVVDDLGWRWAE